MSTPVEPDTNKRSVEHQASETAMATATMRALAAYDEKEEIRGRDSLAEIFLTEDRKRPLQDPAARAWVMKNKLTPGAYEFMLARTAFFDHIVEQALRDNLPQIVFLGAGYDSRPYRFQDLIQATRIFELDAQPTQQRKQELLHQASIPIPEHLAFVPINFNTDDLQEVLVRAGYNRNQKTLFVWEGVTYYLSPQAVDDILSFIRSNSPLGSSICFDYAALSPEALSEDSAKKLRERLKSDHPAEPTRFGIREGELESFLSERGYHIIEHLTPQEMEQKYLTLRDGSSAGMLPALFRLVHATAASPALLGDPLST
jgi:methyltransferase (TIGR00027 family)